MSAIRARYLDLISGRYRGLVFDLARAALSLLALPYLCAVAVRNAYYSLVTPAVRKLSSPVISVGNITVGGTGKTPMAACLANLLLQRDRRVAILLRGYKGRNVRLDDTPQDHASRLWQLESDEALVLKRRCPRASVMVSPDRVKAAREAIHRGANALVLDDGFQHRRLARDLDIVLVDATLPFGYEHLLPRGLLREPPRTLRRADMVILTRSDQIHPTARALLLHRLRHLSAGNPVLQARHKIVGFTDVKGHPVAVDDPTVMQAVVFAGIANFESFRKTVEALGIRVLAAYQYPDHHAYTLGELTGLRDVAADLEANVILTTEKDAVKLLGRWSDEAGPGGSGSGSCRLLAMRLEIEFDDEDGKILAEAIDQVLSDRPEVPGDRAAAKPNHH
jgi:tetraacyldisaccharide 4'-kinase